MLNYSKKALTKLIVRAFVYILLQTYICNLWVAYPNNQAWASSMSSKNSRRCPS
jgi:hypothetical protein